MEGLNGSTYTTGPFGYGYDYSRHQKLEGAIKKVDTPVDMDTWVTCKEFDENYYMRKYNPMTQTSNSAMNQINQEIKSSAEGAIRDFYSGQMSEEEFISKFQALAEKNFQGNHEYVNYGMTSFDMDQVMMKSFYGEFRRTALEIAVEMNNAEGKQYVTGNASKEDWKYYNADYYYKSESAIAALSKGITELAEKHGHEGFQVHDYKGTERWLYHNFNTALSNPMVATEQTFLNGDAIPPKGFVWFSQQGTYDDSNLVAVRTEDYKAPSKFDANNFLTATAWAMLRGPDGTVHKVGADIIYDFSSKDKYTLGKLFQFDGQSQEAKAANDFLLQLQVYRRGYFSDQYSNHRFELRA